MNTAPTIRFDRSEMKVCVGLNLPEITSFIPTGARDTRCDATLFAFVNGFYWCNTVPAISSGYITDYCSLKCISAAAAGAL